MTTFERTRALAERRHATRRTMHKFAVRQWWIDQAHELPIPDSRQPIDRWSERIATGIACFAIGFALMAWVLR